MINFQEIKTNFSGEILTDQTTLRQYSRDASIFEIVPKCVVRPKDTEDVKNLVRWVSANKQASPDLSITARSAGTDMSGGAVNDSIIAEFTAHFNRIEMFGPDYAVAEPGVFYRDFEKQSLERGLILPCYTASKSLNTLGGMAANNSAGEKSLVYGQTTDYVEELHMVLADGNEYVFRALDNFELEGKLKLAGFEGEIYRKMFGLIQANQQLIQQHRPQTSKNASGYYLWNVWDKKRFDLTKLFVGSQGTLGLITKIKFKLVRPRPKSELLVIFLRDLSVLGKLVHRVMDFHPETFESYDDHTFNLAMKFLPDMIKKMSGEAGSVFGGMANIFKLGWSFLPELRLAIFGGVPKLILIAEFTGETEAQVRQNLLRAQEAVKREFGLKTHVTASAREAEKYWTVRRESFNLLRQHSRGLATAPFIDDFIVDPRYLPEFLPQLNKLLDRHPSLVYTIAGHMGNGNFHIIPLMDFRRADQRMIIPRLADQVYDLVIKYHGNITAEHNDGLIRTPYLVKMFGPQMAELFAEVKAIFDPKNIFNPRKKVGATTEYVLAHMKKTSY